MKKILIIRTDRLGDVILSTPVLRSVRENLPESHIAVMVKPYTRECVEGNPYIDEVIVYDKENRERSLFGSLRFAMNLRKKRFDTALILHPANRVNLVAFLAGIPERIGFDRKMGFLLTKKVPHRKQFGQKHELDYSLDILEAAGMKPTTRSLYMPVDRETKRRMEKRLSGLGVRQGDLLVAIHPSSSCPSKKWLPGRFANVADRLIDDYNVKIALIGGPGAANDARAVKDTMKHKPLDLSGGTSVSELAALLKRCVLFISNDSGPVHAASAVGTPVIAIFGRKDAGLGPRRWGPTGEHDIILHKDAGCGKCLAHNCDKGFLCLRAVTEDEVLKAAEMILNRDKQR